MISKADIEVLKPMAENPPQGLVVSRVGGVDSASEKLVLDLVFSGFEKTSVFKLKPEGGKKSVGVGQVRALNSTLSVEAFGRSSARIVVFEKAETLGHEAQNAILKILEEPPKGVFFIFLTGQEDGILPTIKSRCQRVVLHDLREEEFLSLAKERFPLEEEQELELMWLRSGGQMATFLNLMEDEDLRDRSKEIMGEVRVLLGRDGGQAARVLAGVKNRDETKELVQSLALVLATLSEQKMRSGDMDSALRLKDRLSVCEEVLDYLNRNGNFKLGLAKLV